MKTNNLFAEYVAPEVEVLSMVVERGFELSSGIDDVMDIDYGEF